MSIHTIENPHADEDERVQTTPSPTVEEVERVTTYTLADAIRGGSRDTVQVFGRMGGGDQACAARAVIIDAKRLGWL